VLGASLEQVRERAVRVAAALGLPFES